MLELKFSGYIIANFFIWKIQGHDFNQLFQTHESITVAMNVIAYEPSLAVVRQFLARNKEVGKGFCHISHRGGI